MPCTIKLSNNVSIQVPGTTPKEIITAASFWLNEFPKACGNCKSEDISPRHRNSKGYDFFEVNCHACHHTVKISEKKEDHSFFIRWDAKWESPQQRRNNDSGQESKPAESEGDDAW